MSAFEAFVIAFSDRFLSQRSFDLVVAPALADLEYEDAAGRRSTLANRGAVLRAMLGALGRDIQDASPGFLKLTLLSVSCFGFPLFVSGNYFTWSEFFIAFVVVGTALVPVVVCFWPARQSVRPTE
ncbi:MAG: hypothetical protein RLZZ53_1276 [Acidobacteriota bacterium]|jgi:hypothetical protein